jgi:hypothetical protein
MEPKNGGSMLITTRTTHSSANGMIRNRTDGLGPLQGRSQDTTQGAHLAEAQMSTPITIHSTPPDHVRSITSTTLSRALPRETCGQPRSTTPPPARYMLYDHVMLRYIHHAAG